MKKLVVLGIAATLAAGADQGLKPLTAEAQPPFLYSVKYLCGLQTAPPGAPPNEPPVKPGNYATAVNIHNFKPNPVDIRKKAVVAQPQGQPPGTIGNFVVDTLKGNQALEVDCSNIVTLLNQPVLPSFIKGFVEIISPVELSVVAVYTAQVCIDPPGCTAFGDLALEVVPQRSFAP